MSYINGNVVTKMIVSHHQLLKILHLILNYFKLDVLTKVNIYKISFLIIKIDILFYITKKSFSKFSKEKKKQRERLIISMDKTCLLLGMNLTFRMIHSLLDTYFTVTSFIFTSDSPKKRIIIIIIMIKINAKTKKIPFIFIFLTSFFSFLFFLLNNNKEQFLAISCLCGFLRIFKRSRF